MLDVAMRPCAGRAVENEPLCDFREAAEKLMTSVSEINRAQRRVLAAASGIE